MARVAFIGLGNMGGGMAANLAKAGHEVVRVRPRRSRRSTAPTSNGCTDRRSAPTKRSQDADAVVTMLPAGKHVADVYRDSVLRNAPKSAILIDCSTIDVATAKAVEAEAAGRRLRRWSTRRCRAGSPRPSGGTLTFMVGGIATRGSSAPGRILEQDGQGGDPRRRAGRGPGGQDLQQHAARRDHGRRPARRSCWPRSSGSTRRPFSTSRPRPSGQSWSMTSYCPVPGVGPETPADRNYDGGFAAALMLKDLKLAMEAAQGSRRLHADGRRGRGALPALRRPRRRVEGFFGADQDDRRQLGRAEPTPRLDRAAPSAATSHPC